jgi:hypothetical protein
MVFSLENTNVSIEGWFLSSVSLEDREFALSDYGNKTRRLLKRDFSFFGWDLAESIIRCSRDALEFFHTGSPTRQSYQLFGENGDWTLRVGVVKSDSEYLQWMSEVNCLIHETPPAVAACKSGWVGVLSRLWRSQRCTT